ncbi:MAG: hypothetical protein R3D67_12520 [Hyphomicrobiaceae bacterium]
MSDAEHTFTGRCHCGAVTAELKFTRPAEEMQVRSCQCEFCIRHGSLTASDPAGHAIFQIEAGALQPYRFGTNTAMAIICRHCGAYAGIAYTDGGRTWSAANMRGLGVEEFKERVGVQMFYEDETPTERVERRKQKWTPTEVRFKL